MTPEQFYNIYPPQIVGVLAIVAILAQLLVYRYRRDITDLFLVFAFVMWVLQYFYFVPNTAAFPRRTPVATALLSDTVLLIAVILHRLPDIMRAVLTAWNWIKGLWKQARLRLPY